MGNVRRLLFLGLMLAASCATTTIGGTWRSPRFAGPPLRKVLVCAESPDIAIRRRLEDEFVRQLTKDGVQATQCYSVLPSERVSAAQLRQALTSSGMDGLVVVKVTHITQSPTDVGPGYYSGPYYYDWDRDWNYAYGSDYALTQTEVTLQTKAYSALQNGALLWVANSHTVDPTSFDSLISAAVPKFVDRMAKAGIVASNRIPPGAVGQLDTGRN